MQQAPPIVRLAALLTGLLPALLATVLAALTRILGLLARLLLAALLTTLVRIVLALLVVTHSRYSWFAAPSAVKTRRAGSLFREPVPNRSHQSETFPQKWLKGGLSRP
jgi:hypothetical protein